jgi:hypothetical protein
MNNKDKAKELFKKAGKLVEEINELIKKRQEKQWLDEFAGKK